MRVGDEVPASFAALCAAGRVTPIYEEHDGYPSFDGARWRDVPPAAKRLVDRIEQLADTPVRRLSASRAGPPFSRGC